MKLGSLCIKSREQGLTLIEILVALGIVAAVAVIFLLGMSTSSRAVLVSQERITVESLAKAEMEYVKSSVYTSANVTWTYELPSDPPSWDPTHSIPASYPDGYTVQVDGSVVPGHDYDDGIQKITVTVNHEGEPSITIEGYKTQ
jgi:prepilin-type N-terminal cleavage/methylation domain-containing protein